MSRQVTHDGIGNLRIRFPFDRRLVDLVKGLPARRWNPSEKIWTVPEGDVVEVVELLRSEGFGFDDATRRLYSERGGGLVLEGPSGTGAPRSGLGLFDAEPEAEIGGATAVTAAGDYTVSRLNEQVRAVLSEAFPAPVWLVGEISGFNKNQHKRIVTFQLVEQDEQGRNLAQVGATLFEGPRREIEKRLAAAGDPFRLEDEITVRVRARVELYVPWGSYRVLVDDLDLAYTLGEAARRREEIIRRLAAEGILERNRALPFPALPLRVGLITSLGSDAFNDVLRTFQESGFAFRVTAHGARVQGRQTEPSVLNALDWFRDRAAEFDVILICRGGGSRTDLAWFDSEPLARAVAGYPLPVVVGIGHEQDQSVLDAVGWRCKTPTAAAGFLVDSVASSQDRVEETARGVLGGASRILQREEIAERDRARRLARAARGLLDRELAELGHRRGRTVRGARALLRSASLELARRGPAVPRSAGLLLARQSGLLTEAGRRVGHGARRDLASALRGMTESAQRVGPRAGVRLTLEVERLDGRARRLHLVDPRRVVERGYAVIRSVEGKVVSDSAAAPPGSLLRAELRRGILRARSEGTEEI